LRKQGLFSFHAKNVIELRGIAHKRIDPGLHERANFGRFPVARIAAKK